MKYRVDNKDDGWSLPAPMLSDGIYYPLNIEHKVEHWWINTNWWYIEFTVVWNISFELNNYWILPDYGVV